MTNRRSRRQTRQRRNDGWPPEQHNAAVAGRKALIRLAKRHDELRRERARAMRRFGVATALAAEGMRILGIAVIECGNQAAKMALAAEAARERERQRQIAHADRMAAAGFDMREEHEALERGELVD